MEQKLKDYSKDKTHYTPIMNIIMNNRSENWYAELGKYINEK
jgi:cytochrome c553